MSIDFSEALKSLNGMVVGFFHQLPYLVLALIVYLFFYISAKGLRQLTTRFTESRQRHRNAAMVLGRLAEGGLLLIGALVALVIAIPSFHPGELIQLLGISSVAVGFAFRDILQNFLAGILILLTEPFRIDDQIVVGNFEGTVENIETRATFIRTYDGRRVVIPNSTLFTEAVTVNTAYPSRRLEYDVGIGYGDDIEQAQKIILTALAEASSVLADPPPEVLVIALAGSTINLRVRWWIKPPRRADALESQNQVLAAIKNKLTASGIDLPFPTHQILFHDQTEETDGDRRRQREGWPAGTGAAPAPRPLASALLQRRNGGRPDAEPPQERGGG